MIVATYGVVQIIVLDSISYIGMAERGHVVVSGSHGGLAAARYALAHPPAGVIFNDAGGGKEQAGVIGLRLLEEAGIAACAVAHTSARIGEGEDTWQNGLISAVNPLAAAQGVRIGMSCREAAAALATKAR